MNRNCTGSQIHLKKKLCGFTEKQSSTYFIIAYIITVLNVVCKLVGGGSLSWIVNQEVRWGGVGGTATSSDVYYKA